MKAVVQPELAFTRRGDDAFHFLNAGVLEVQAAGHRIDVRNGFVLSAVGHVAQLDAAKVFDPPPALNTWDEEPQRALVFGPQHFAVLSIGDQYLAAQAKAHGHGPSH